MAKDTEYRQTEEALRRSEERFRGLTESTSDIIWEIDGKAVYTYVNPKITDVLGYQPEEVIGRRPFYEFLVVPEDRTRIRNEFQAFLKEKKPFIRFENRNLHKDGRTVILESNGVPFFDARGRFRGFRGIDRDVTETRLLRENMEFYRRQMVIAQEEERKRIARELHDETAQSLASLSVAIGDIILMMEKDGDVACQRLQKIPSKIEQTVEEVRRFSHALRPSLLDKFGLTSSLKLLAREMKTDHDLNCVVKVTGAEVDLSPEIELTAYRIIQEALHNTTKHTKATKATIGITFSHDAVKVEIIDNGDGFKLPAMLSNYARSGKLGLISMNERANLVGGTFKISSNQGIGTTVSIEIPREVKFSPPKA
jgi:PAS domain S-box-containing protein